MVSSAREEGRRECQTRARHCLATFELLHIYPLSFSPHPIHPTNTQKHIKFSTNHKLFSALIIISDGQRIRDSTEQLRNLLLMQQGTRDQMATLDPKTRPLYADPVASVPAAQQYGMAPKYAANQDFPQAADFSKYPAAAAAQDYGLQDRYSAPNVVPCLPFSPLSPFSFIPI
jgi:hypothetical protein